MVASSLKELKAEYPPVGRLALTGHAHLDLAWLWPVSETMRKGRRTFASVLSLMERYDDFVFNQSSAQLYEWIEAESPEIFERVRRRVEEGRWEPVGGSWVESRTARSHPANLWCARCSMARGISRRSSAIARGWPGCPTPSGSLRRSRNYSGVLGWRASSPTSSTGARPTSSLTTSTSGRA